MKRKVWVRAFHHKAIPRYPCPQCLEPSLKIDGKVEEREPNYSKANHKHEEFEPQWVTERVNFRLICDVPECGEVVNAIGEMVWDYDYDEDGYAGEIQLISPTAFFPPLPMIDFPSEFPNKPKTALEQAFAVCWADTGSAANRIRVSV